MRVSGTLFFASAVLLNSIEFSIQTGPSGSSSNPTAQPPGKPPPKTPRQPPAKKPKLAKGASGSTPKQPEHPGASHPEPHPKSTTHPGSSSAHPPPAPGAPPAPNTKTSKKANPNPDLGNWPRILTPGTQLGLGKAPMVPTGYISLDSHYEIIGTTLDKLGFKRLTIHEISGVELKFRKYTFFSDQKLMLFFDLTVNEPTMIPDVEHIVIVNAQDFALAILMPNGNILGVYSGNRKGRRKVNTNTNFVDEMKGAEKNHVLVGLKFKIPSPRYEMHESETNSLLVSYGQKGGGGLKPPAPIDPPKMGRPRKRPQQNP